MGTVIIFITITEIKGVAKLQLHATSLENVIKLQLIAITKVGRSKPTLVNMPKSGQYRQYESEWSIKSFKWPILVVD